MRNGFADAGRDRWIHAAALILLILALALPRLTALDRYVTIDEPTWLMNSANFYQALWTRDWKNTYQLEHPGVTITWAGTLGFLWKFPGYVKLVNGQFNKEDKFRQFLVSKSHTALDMLVAGRTFTALAVIFVLLLAFPLMVRLAGWGLALLAFLLIALDPYFIALSKLLHLDGLVTALMLLSLLAYLRYLDKGRQKRDLLLSGVAAGLSWLTKSPAFFLIPFMGLLVLIELFNSWKRIGIVDLRNRATWLRSIWAAASPWLVWLIIGGIVFILLWPAMWVDPIGTLSQVFGGATGYALEGNSHITFFAGQVIDVGQSVWYYYPLSILWRITPPVLIGVLVLAVACLFPKKFSLSRDHRRMAWVMGLFTLLFIIFITLSQKKADRYQIPVQPALCIQAAIGWYVLFERLGDWVGLRFPGAPLRLLMPLFGGVIVFWQLLGVLQTAPYYMNYYNPLLGGDRAAPGVMMIGRGEGLDQAARYLDSLPNARNLRVYAWYGEGPFSYYFDGETIIIEANTALSDLLNADYAVLYIHQWQRQLPSKEVLDFFAQMTPVYVARIGNLDYAKVYDLRNAKH
jgi:4-amino-4-deoxy-L-arabinose transferase-like glycosyltransferase